MRATSLDRWIPLPRHWSRRVRSAIVHAVSMADVAFTAAVARAENHSDEWVRLRALNARLERRNELLVEELRIKDARMARIDPRRRPHDPPAERLGILVLRGACGWSLQETARRSLVTPLTLTHWMQRLDDDGPDALVQVAEPVNRFPDLVTYLVRKLKAFCPRMGARRIAAVLTRASLHVGSTTVRRMLKPPAKRPKRKARAAGPRVVTAKRRNHVWHVDLTAVPTIGGFWISWLPFSLPQRWPFCWWVAVVVDHFSRRALGKATFKKEPSEADVEKFLTRTIRTVDARPDHHIRDHGPQFTAEGFDAWCRRRKVNQRFGAIGKYGSIAVIERFIKSLKSECTRLLPIVPLAQAAFARELDAYIAWYNAERPHSRFEPRERWPRRSRCAGPQAIIRGRPGAVLELTVTHLGGRTHLPIVTLRLVA
jgi:transposase InsO family protein